jgi:Tol biopolymer transport system component
MGTSRRPISRNLDLLMVVLLALLVVGGHILVWADDPERGLVSGNQLFSIWALPVYLGFLPAAYVLFLWWSGRRRGGGVPLGYRAALAGAALFLLALIAEFAWRSAGGRPEGGPAGVLAPARIGLFVGAALMVSGPLISLRGRLAATGSMPGRINSIDAAAFSVALGLLLSLTTLLTGFVHPFVVRAGAPMEQPPRETPTDLYRVPVNGTGSQRLTVSPTEWEAHPDVSADGALAYGVGPLEGFRVLTDSIAAPIDSREVHQDGPVWSPDGSRIAYWAELNAPAATPAPATPGPGPGSTSEPRPVDITGLAIWIYDIQEGTSAPLNQVGGEGVESWSPDATTLCGWSVGGGSFDIATWDVATGVMRQVTNGPGDEWGCSWSPDGSRIAFHSDRTGNWEIYSALPDGTDVRQLTDDEGIDQWPQWSPDGAQLAWMSSRDGNLDIYVAGISDSGITTAQNITSDPALEDGYYGLTWEPDGSALVAASAGRSYAAPSPAETQPLGVGAIVLNALIVVGVLLFGLRLVGPMVGLGTIVGLINGLLAALVGGEPLFFFSVLAAGIAADVVFARGGPSKRRLAATMAGASAFVLVLSYFLLLIEGVSWGLDLVVGSVILSTVLAIGLALIATWDGPDQSAISETA